MAAGLLTVIGTALVGVATTAGVFAVNAEAERAGLTMQDIQLVRCIGVREEFSPLLGRTQPVWVLSRAGGTPEAACRHEGDASPGAVRFERVPGASGVPRLLV